MLSFLLIALHFFFFFSLAWSDLQNSTFSCNPIIVGGIGGSGTRGVIAFLEEAGMKPPKRVNKAHDIRISETDESLFVLADRVMEDTESIWYEIEELNPKTLRLFQEIFEEIHTLCTPERGVKWGFKAPNTMFLVPLWAKVYPEMCFIHVVRDGRDMAYSLRQRQADVLFNSFFCDSSSQIDDYIRKALFWQRANLQLYEKGTVYLRERYNLVKIEDLMDEGSRYQSGRKLLQNLGMGNVIQTPEFRKALNVFDTNLGGTKGTEVNLEETYGKWKEQPIQQIRELEMTILRALKTFDYPLISRNRS